MTVEARFVQALALGLDPAWRRLPEAQRCEDARSFTTAVTTSPAFFSRDSWTTDGLSAYTCRMKSAASMSTAGTRRRAKLV